MQTVTVKITILQDLWNIYYAAVVRSGCHQSQCSAADSEIRKISGAVVRIFYGFRCYFR